MSPQQIEDIVSNYFQLENIFLNTRRREIVTARKFFNLFMKKHTGLSLAEIGRYNADKIYDHATILHSIKTLENLLEFNKDIQADYENLKKLIKTHNMKRNSLIPDEVDLMALIS